MARARRPRRSPFALVWLIAPLLLLAVLVAPGTPAPRPAPTPAGDTPIGAACAPDNQACLIMAWSSAVDTIGVSATVAAFEARLPNEPLIASACHPIAHAIGSGAYDVYDDSVAALLAGSEACAGGYSHAVLVRELMDVPSDAIEALVARGMAVCTTPAVAADDVLITECAHGIGHAIVVRLSDIDTAIAGCMQIEAMPEAWLSIICADGAIMESFEPTDNRRRSIVTEGADPVVPCLSLARLEHQARCVHYAIRRLEDPSVAGQLARCATFEAPIVRDDCINGSISQAATGGDLSPESVPALCMPMADPTACVNYAATALGYLKERLEPEVAALCTTAGVETASCIAAAAMQVRDLLGAPAAEAACRAGDWSAAVRDACLVEARRQ